ncbi:MAG: MarR family winged helix-turn-helix transcriptional regulator [Candidatus Sphingomonas phytovorans]|nr:MarR family winged helix-turn-helix transcriptional regulator [Sphingomonas sp.]WEK01141.1 MAG: MarR family winged helix-turn-helix transcriptional regulator [Sphingomonas sp.]
MAKPLLLLDSFLPYRLSFTSNLVSDVIASTYETLFALRIPDWRVIAVAAENPDGITQQEIGLRTRMDKVTVSRAAIALIDRGLVARRPISGDRRSHLLYLTPAGRELYRTVAPKALDLERQIFSEFPKEDLVRFEAMLRRIDQIVADLEINNAN